MQSGRDAHNWFLCTYTSLINTPLPPFCLPNIAKCFSLMELNTNSEPCWQRRLGNVQLQTSRPCSTEQNKEEISSGPRANTRKHLAHVTDRWMLDAIFPLRANNKNRSSVVSSAPWLNSRMMFQLCVAHLKISIQASTTTLILAYIYRVIIMCQVLSMAFHALLHLVFPTISCDKFTLILILQLRKLNACMVK